MSITSNLRHLSEIAGVSGDERRVRQFVEAAIRDHVDELRVDSLGNLLAVKSARVSRGRRAMRVMVDAHMDEVGFIVVGHSSDGGLKFRAVGGVDARILPGKVLSVSPDQIPGVIGVHPVHLSDGDSAVKSIDSLVIDIGASNREQAEGAAPAGTYASFSTRYRALGRSRVSGKAFDDRAGCSVLIELLRGPRLPVDILAAFTVQEEVGLRGAHVAAYTLNPDAAFAIDATPANDLPMHEDRSPNTRLGEGPAIYVLTRGDVSDPRLVLHVMGVGEKKHIPHQIRQPGAGGTDAAAISRTRSGVPTISISTPCRYIHSPVSVLSLADLKNSAALLRESIASLTPQVLER